MRIETPEQIAGLLTLAERCEAASGRDKHLGREVLLACGMGYVSPLQRWMDPTASLDAAMTLVPEGLRWCVDTCDGKPRSFVEPLHPYDGQPWWGNGTTPALALCAAALRAHAATLTPQVTA